MSSRPLARPYKRKFGHIINSRDGYRLDSKRVLNKRTNSILITNAGVFTIVLEVSNFEIYFGLVLSYDPE